MNKKFVRYKNMEDGDPDSDSQRLLDNISQKLENSAALNGGFDRLLYKIDAIETSQGQIVTKVDKIHEAIYHPDDGLFARIASNKNEHNELVSELEKNVIEINSWKDHQLKDIEDSEKESVVLTTKIHQLEMDVDNLKRSKLLVYSISKWILAAIGGGLVTALFQILYTALNIKK